MAIENKRVIDLANESTSLAGDEYVLLDSNNTGTTKYRLSRLSDKIDAGVGALGARIDSEATARQSADDALQSAITSEVSARQTADTALEGEITDLKDDLNDAINNGKTLINKTVNWQSGYVRTNGIIGASSVSGYALVEMSAGETVTIGTRNTNITIIGSTTQSSLSVGDAVDRVLQTTSGEDQYETYTYTATVNITLVLCVSLAEYNIKFEKDAEIVETIETAADYMTIDSAGNNTFVEAEYINDVVSGHFYDIVLKHYPHNNVPTGGGYLFRISYTVNGGSKTYIRSVAQTETLASNYLVYIPDGLSNVKLRIGGRINSGETAIISVVDVTNDVLPDYVETMVTSINSALLDHQSSNSISFPFVTDIHVRNTNINTGVLWAMLMSKFAINRINQTNPLDLCVFNGDYLYNGTTTTKAECINFYNGLNKVLEGLNVPSWRGKGNHDINDIATDSSQHMTDEDYYRCCMKYTDIEKFDMQYGEIDRCYGYYDDTNRKVRIIFINTVDVPSNYTEQYVIGISNEQLNFIANALYFTEPDWGVVFVSHHALQDNDVINPDDSTDMYLTDYHGGVLLRGVINAFINKTSYTDSQSITGWEYSVNVDYSNNASNEVIAMLSGHSHADRMTVVNGYVMLSTTSAGISVGGKDASGASINKVQYTQTETSWDIITIDRKNKMLYADRFGGGTSRSSAYGN